MITEKWLLTNAEIIIAREKLYRGYNDLGTEQALRWFVTNHPHPLSEVIEKCKWCVFERKVLESIHCATRCADEAWWKEFVPRADGERHEIGEQIGGYCFTFVRIGLPDGRWWYAKVIDPKNIKVDDFAVIERKKEPSRWE